MSSTFHIIQSECAECEACIAPSNGLIKIGVDGKPVFVKTETDTANFGDDEARYIFAAKNECPNDCIEEIG